MKKKFLAILLACAMAAGLAVSPAGTETAWARSENEKEYYVEGFGAVKCRIDGDSITIIRYTGGTPEPVIPESIDGKTVTSIGDRAIRWNSYLKGISIPSTVTSIGFEAFDGSALNRIDIPSSVTSIGNSAFAHCEELKSVNLGSGLTNLNKDLFFWCKSLESVNISPGVTNIDDGVFQWCSSLKSIDIPSGVINIGNHAFSNCGNLKNVNLPSSITSIGESAFLECKALTSINLPSSITSISDGALFGCSSLTSISIPSGVTSIGEDAFGVCPSLRSVYLPSSVTSIGLRAFEDCEELEVYYDGSKEQWNKISIAGGNEALIYANIHYNSTGEDSKSEQTITAKNITKTYGAKPFKLNAKSSVGAALTYAVSNKNVATVDKNGKVTIKGCGITNITITAKKKGDYSQAKKTIKLTVKPKKMALSSVKSTKKSTAAVKWKQDKKASGYIIQCATDSKFKKNKVQVTVSKNKTVSATVKKLKAGKKYYVRVCAYARSGKTKVQGDWSKVKTVKVKK